MLVGPSSEDRTAGTVGNWRSTDADAAGSISGFSSGSVRASLTVVPSDWESLELEDRGGAGGGNLCGGAAQISRLTQ